jgi:hypothetical protein
LRSVICLYCDEEVLQKTASSSASIFKKELYIPQKTFDINNIILKKLRLNLSDTEKSAENRIAWSIFNNKLNNKNNSIYSFSLLLTSQILIKKFIDLYSNYTAFPELLNPIYIILKQLRPQDIPNKTQNNYLKSHLNLLESITNNNQIITNNRIVLQWRKHVKTSIITKNPKFQADYTFKKDLDPDEDRVKLKQLTR